MGRNLDEDDDLDLMEDEPDMMPPPRQTRSRAKREEDESFYSNPEDELFKCYGIRPNLPLRTKVEHLHLTYRLPVTQIADLLKISSNVVLDEIEELKEDWKRMGKPLTSDDREMERGRLIAGLDRLIQQIDDQIIASGDGSKVLSLKLNAMEKRAKLLGLEFDKRQQAVEDETAEASILETVEQRIEAMPSDMLEQMMARLEGEVDQFSSGEPPSSSSSSEPALSGLANAELKTEGPPVSSSSSSPSAPGRWDDLD